MRSRSSSRTPARRSRSSKALDRHLASGGLQPFDRDALRVFLAGAGNPVPGEALKQVGSPSSGTDNACRQALIAAEWGRSGVVLRPLSRDRLILIALDSFVPASLDPASLDPASLLPASLVSASLLPASLVPASSVLESLQDPVPRCAVSCRDSAFAPPARSDVTDRCADLRQATPNRPLPRLCRVTEPVRDPDASRRVHDLLVH